MHYRYMNKMQMAADLKRAAHAVRQAVDNDDRIVLGNGRTINPRQARMVSITADSGASMQLPDLAPRHRHKLAMRRQDNYSEFARARDTFGWYVESMIDRNARGRK